MMQIFSGTIKAPASKSSSLRAIICSSLTRAEGPITIHNISLCQDVLVGIDLISSLKGLSYSWNNDDLELFPSKSDFEKKRHLTLQVGESGFLARVMVSIGTLFSPEFVIRGEGTLLKRELGIEEFAQKVGLSASSSKLPVIIQGSLQAGELLISENQSSQFLSGLIFALPLLPKESILNINKIVSRPYIDLTLKYLESSGISYKWLDGEKLLIPGNQQYDFREITGESDWSSLSFFIVLGIINGDVTIRNIIDAPSLPDRIILKLLDKIGGNYSFPNSTTLEVKKSEVQGFTFDLTSNPDLAPVLVALAITATSSSEFRNCYRLRDKESDRLISIIEMLKVLEVSYDLCDDTLVINPSEVSGGLVKTFNDHRIAMSALILNVISRDKITIDNYQCINKSYPNFLNDLKLIGVEI